ncbi:uroporphyrinogen-III synthase [Pseudoteredinibacter isoporae]|uniref:Uroporphyrinogen-III synthase n=1 Tax=Pseudoteredinibacter isoporae TaxID=570281 RepID=A0A7X0JPK1_9GAMM|nr:uroporphyrinogen-III synthase [Pseudoteredinibacter isoporae]MBB6519924.1 uroporphyrinogen-III synthase [Pseudoteredinibacter isoporae]NHO85500.1 uroporphyrinogen-III synthase [Pseudoteredinibacter isoporae]NIB26048.1 uroporphyrinogen-III synthase [Pseudoteredinibacter isoporae]
MSTMNFTGLDVLLCRPRGAASSLPQRIELAGGQLFHVPCMQIIALDEPQAVAAIKSRILDFDHYPYVIFISQNAVKYAESWIDQYWPQLPMGQQYLAIGAATAEAAANMGFAEMAQAEGAMDSEALLALPALQELSDKKVLIFRGQGGRETLARALRERGATVDYCELYRRACPEGLPEALAASPFAKSDGRRVIMVHSGESLENLHQGIQKAGLTSWKHDELICPSQRVAELATGLGFDRVHAASNAGEPAMLTVLQQLAAQQPT